MAMVGALEGGAVLVLLSVFFAHMLAPAVAAIRRRVRIGPRQRPISRPVAIVLLYLAVFVPGAILWRGAKDNAVHWGAVTRTQWTALSFAPRQTIAPGTNTAR